MICFALLLLLLVDHCDREFQVPTEFALLNGIQHDERYSVDIQISRDHLQLLPERFKHQQWLEQQKGQEQADQQRCPEGEVQSAEDKGNMKCEGPTSIEGAAVAALEAGSNGRDGYEFVRTSVRTSAEGDIAAEPAGAAAAVVQPTETAPEGGAAAESARALQGGPSSLTSVQQQLRQGEQQQQQGQGEQWQLSLGPESNHQGDNRLREQREQEPQPDEDADWESGNEQEEVEDREHQQQLVIVHSLSAHFLCRDSGREGRDRWNLGKFQRELDDFVGWSARKMSRVSGPCEVDVGCPWGLRNRPKIQLANGVGLGSSFAHK